MTTEITEETVIVLLDQFEDGLWPNWRENGELLDTVRADMELARHAYNEQRTQTSLPSIKKRDVERFFSSLRKLQELLGDLRRELADERLMHQVASSQIKEKRESQIKERDVLAWEQYITALGTLKDLGVVVRQSTDLLEPTLSNSICRLATATGPRNDGGRDYALRVAVAILEDTWRQIATNPGSRHTTSGTTSLFIQAALEQVGIKTSDRTIAELPDEELPDLF